MEIREARPADAQEIAALVARNLREVNAKDHPPHVVEQLIKDLTPRVVAGRIERWRVLVAEHQESIVGTVGLDAHRLRMFFIASEHQRGGIGTSLLNRILGAARAEGVELLEVQAAPSAQAFYRKRGFIRIGEVTDRDQVTILMKRPLTATQTPVRDRLTASMRRRDTALPGTDSN